MIAPSLNRQLLELESHEPTVESLCRAWDSEQNVKRLWGLDQNLWTGKDESSWLGWLHVVERQISSLSTLNSLQSQVEQEQFMHAVVLGMGGASLCPELMSKAFPPRQGFPKLSILDSTDPGQISLLEQELGTAKTLFIVASKSGETLETNMLESYFFEKIADGSRFLAITDPGTLLEKKAIEKRYWRIFHGEPMIGGRFSALSHFGMVPAAVMGLDLERFLDSAKVMVLACGEEIAPSNNPGVMLGLTLAALARNGRDKLTFVTTSNLRHFGAWLEQLLAESTGKNGRGILPVDLEPNCGADAYGNDRVFVRFCLAGSEYPPVPKAHPVISIEMDSIYELSQEFFRWEIAVAVASAVLGLNPFDQPQVELTKTRTRELIERGDKVVGLQSENARVLLPSDVSLDSFLDQLVEGDYCAIMAYVVRTKENENLLQEIRKYILKSRRVATTLGFGPRLLHSTGQFYKGGTNRGIFIQIRSDDTKDLEIPRQPITFGMLKNFQADADLEILRKQGRRVLPLRIGTDAVTGLRALVDFFS